MGRLIAFDFFGFWEKFKPVVEGMKSCGGEIALIDPDELYATLGEINKDMVMSIDESPQFAGMHKKDSPSKP